MIDKDLISNWEILVLDDEPDSLEVILRVLTFYGARVHTASSGSEGLAILKKIVPTFIITDLSMPDMDGWEFLHTVQNNPMTARIPVFALTAHAMAGDRDRAIRAGFNYYLTKPLKPGRFLKDLGAAFAANPEIADKVGYVSEN